MIPEQSNNKGKKVECRWGSFYLVISLMEMVWQITKTEKLAEYWLEISVYITGLITQTNVTATAIAQEVGVVSHDKLSRMLKALGCTIEEGAILSVKLIEALGLKGCLIIDDVLLPKPFAKALAYCGWDWDHSRKINVFGQRLVFIVWSNGKITIPLLFAFWQKGPKTVKKKKRAKAKLGRRCKLGRKISNYSAKARARRARYKARLRVKLRRKRLENGVHVRTKNELARCLVWKLVRAGIKSEFILFDSWYGSKENTALFERLKLKWVSRTKENTKVYFNGEFLEVRQLANTVKKANYHYYDVLGARVRSFQVKVADRFLKLTVIKDDTSKESGRTKYLITNALWLTNMEHVFWYRRRWAIEVFFRDAKQELGLNKCEARIASVITSHILLVCLTYTFLQLLKPMEFQHRPSVKHSIHTFASLIVVASPVKQFVRFSISGKLDLVSILSFWDSFRTRFYNLPCPESPLFTCT